MVTSHLSIYKKIKIAAVPKHLISQPYQIGWCLIGHTAQKGFKREMEDKSAVLSGRNS